MSLLIHQIISEIRGYISEHNFRQMSMTNTLFASKINELLENNPRIKLSRITNGKTILYVRPSTSENKVVIRYGDHSSGTMMIKNFLRNFNVAELDEWDEDNEDREQDMLLMRLGIRT